MTQITAVELQITRREVAERPQGRSKAGVVQNHPLEVFGQSRTAQQIDANHRRQAQAECPAVIVLEQAMAFHHDDIQTVMRVAEDVGVVVAEQLIKHQAAAARHLRHAHAFGKALRGI